MAGVGFGIAASLRNLFAAAGPALLPTPPGAMLFTPWRLPPSVRVAAKAREQDTRLSFRPQLDGGLWVVTARGLGNPVAPDFADEFFHDSGDFPTGVFVGV